MRGFGHGFPMSLLLKHVGKLLLHSVIGLKEPRSIEISSLSTALHMYPEADFVDATSTRRRFLMGAAVAAAAADTTATAGHLVQAPTALPMPATDTTDDSATDYRLSEYVHKYYRMTWI